MENLSYLIEFKLLNLDENEDEAFAAISLNPAVSWAKFILTDDKPNANKQRVPLEEFDNIIKTGIFMPIKMAVGEIADGHSDSLPLGVITHLKKVNNQIHGLAALWERERPEDIEYIKNRYKNGEQLQLSWELLYTDSAIKEDGSAIDLLGVALRAVTLVGMPAYQGRTPIIAVAATENSKENDSNIMEDLEQLKAKITELEAALSTKDAEVSAKDSELTALKTELEGLREFKSAVEKDKEETERFMGIQRKFSDAKIEKDTLYFTENKEKLLALSEEALDFMLQEMISFSSKKEDNKETTSSKIPNLTGSTKPTKADLVEYLKVRNKK